MESLVTEPLKQQIQPVLQQVPEQAGKLVDQIQGQIKAQLAGQVERTAGGLGTLAQALSQTHQQLRDQGHENIGQYMDHAAGSAQQLADYLRQRDLDQLIGEAESYARRRPGLFLGAAFALGLLAARFVKSSESNAGAASFPDASATTVGTYPPSAWESGPVAAAGLGGPEAGRGDDREVRRGNGA